jgi:polar amino acid transport system substrate-binding protein
MTVRSKLSQWLIAAAGLACALAAPGASAGVLRVCADPDNLPFSKSEGRERGMYIELAELVGKQLDQPVEYVWWLTYNQRKALRNTILQDGCDAYFALPADADYKLRGLQRSKSFINVSYAAVAAPGVTVAALADLKGKRLGVLHATPPHILLSQLEGYGTTSFRHESEAFDALAKGEIDIALLWGPTAGYENLNRLQNRWRVTSLAGEGLNGQMAVAVRKGNDALASAIDKALVTLQPEIAALAKKYGFPMGQPVQLSGATSGRPDGFPSHARVSSAAKTTAAASALVVGSGWVRTSSAAEPARLLAQATPASTPAAAAAKPAPPAGPVDDAAGKVRFNDVCSHCHGNNGASAISERDLRRLKLRYKDSWRETALKTIKEGRPDLGMPSWKASYDDKQIEELLTFISTLQK